MQQSEGTFPFGAGSPETAKAIETALVEQLNSPAHFGSVEESVKHMDRFIMELKTDLAQQEQDNTTSLLQSGGDNNMWVRLIDVATARARAVSNQLETCDMSHVKELDTTLYGKNRRVDIRDKNIILLTESLGNIVDRLDIKPETEYILENPDFKSAEGVGKALHAAEAVWDVLHNDLAPVVDKLSGAQAQKQKATMLLDTFLRAVSHFLNGLFVNLTDMLKVNTASTAEKAENAVREQLRVYTHLMHWLKVSSLKYYAVAQSSYANAFSPYFVMNFEQEVVIVKQEKGIGKTRKSNMTRLGVPDDVQSMRSVGTTLVSDRRQKWIEAYFDVLSRLEPIYQWEREFIKEFFHLTSEELVKDELLRRLFPKYEPILSQLSLAAFEADGFTSVAIFIALRQSLDIVSTNTEDMDVQLKQIYSTALLNTKRSLDKYIEGMSDEIQNYIIMKSKRCGVLPFVQTFSSFLFSAHQEFNRDEQKIARNGEIRRAIQDVIVPALFNKIDYVSTNHPKTPESVILLENYHVLFDAMKTSGFSYLSAEQTRAGKIYKENVTRYVKQHLGQPMERLSNFFDALSLKLNNGVKPADIVYQTAFSETEYRRVREESSLKEIKKGLEKTFASVNKHFTAQSSLILVVWHRMMNELVMVREEYEKTLKLIYPKEELPITKPQLMDLFQQISK